MNSIETLIQRPITAWMGGTRPLPLSQISREERIAVALLFEDQVKDFLGFWGDNPVMDTYRIFWRRARYDAHATFRNPRF